MQYRIAHISYIGGKEPTKRKTKTQKMKNITYSNTTSSVQVVGFKSDGAQVLASFGESLSGLSKLPYSDAARHPLRDAIRAANAWIEENNGAEGLNVDSLKIVEPGVETTESVY